MTDAATSAPASSTSCLKIWRSSPLLIASKFAPMSSMSYFSRMPLLCRSIAALSAVWPPSVGRMASGRSLAMIVSMTCQRDRLDVGRVGEVGVGHDRRRVGVHEDDAHTLLAQHAARLRARVVELARLADDDRARPDDEDALDVVALWHLLGVLLGEVRDDEVAEAVEQIVGVVRVRRRPRGGTAPRTRGCRGRGGPRRPGR